MQDLSSAMFDVGKRILPEHLVLTADYLTSTGEFIALNAKGLSDQRNANCVSAPFSQACFKVIVDQTISTSNFPSYSDIVSAILFLLECRALATLLLKQPRRNWLMIYKGLQKL